MLWTCKKCGKELDISAEQLAETNGVVVCPQCLATAAVPASKWKRAVKEAKPPKADDTPNADDTPKPAARKQVAAKPKPATRKKATPPPYKAPATTPPPPPVYHKQQYTAMTTPSTTPAAPAPKKKKKKSKSRGLLEPHSALGCLWRSALVTLVLLAFYIFFGMIMQGI